VAAELDRVGIDHWLFGGYAVAFHAADLTRPHRDIDLAVRSSDGAAIGRLLVSTGWTHGPGPAEDGGTGFERGEGRLELTLVAIDGDRRVSIVFRDGPSPWSEDPFGEETRELRGARVRVVPLEVLKRGKSTPRPDPADAALDRADYAVLSRL
jgi:hypothetical protein